MAWADTHQGGCLIQRHVLCQQAIENLCLVCSLGVNVTLFGIGATDSARVNLIKRDATHSDCSGFAAPAPLRVWFIDDIPKFSKGRYFATININQSANVHSYFEDESVNSPLNTLVSLESDHSYGVATPNP